MAEPSGKEFYALSDPFNIRVMDMDDFVKQFHVQQVTSQLVYEPSSTLFNPQGLYSESIFGQIGTEERFFQFGYIDLNATVIAPVLYKNLIALGDIYEGILSGKTMAVWDPKIKNFVGITGDPELHKGADTGYSFFMKHYHEIVFPLTPSVQRRTRVELLDKFRLRGLYTKFLVSPAGTRDIQNDDGRIVQDDINGLYRSVMTYAAAIPPGNTSPLYDNVRYNIQSKLMEIYEYLDNLMSGKRGFLQAHFTSRRIAFGTRNVISAAMNITQRPDSPHALKVDETICGLFQCMKAIQPLMVYGIKTVFMSPIFGADSGSLTIPLIDPDTLALEYVDITDTERQLFMSSDGIGSLINRFVNNDVRFKNVTVKGEDKKSYYLALVYDAGDHLYMFRSKADAKRILESNHEIFEERRLRPITWVELFYLICADQVVGRHCLITRYPVLENFSCYPSKIHVTATSPSRVVKVVSALDGADGPGREYPEYPIIGGAFCDTIVPHSSMLKGLGADFDGDDLFV